MSNKLTADTAKSLSKQNHKGVDLTHINVKILDATIKGAFYIEHLGGLSHKEESTLRARGFTVTQKQLVINSTACHIISW